MQFQRKRIAILTALSLWWVNGLMFCAQDAQSMAAAQDGGRPLEDLGPTLLPVLKNHRVPALAGAVIRADRTVAIGVVGVRKMGADAAARIDDQFHLGSCTKAMTATLIGVLIDEGKLRWDMTLDEALPDLARQIHKDYRNVNLDQLLRHRAGLPPNEPPGMTMRDLHALKGSPTQQRRQYVSALLVAAPASKPNTRFSYSNAGYAVLGFIAETVTGTSWQQLIQDRIFRPLGITTAGFGSMGRPGKIEQPWQHVVDNGQSKPIEPGPLSDNPKVMSPAGRVHCSIGDWAKFVAIHVDPDGARQSLLDPATMRRLHTATRGGEDAAGWMVVRRPWGGGNVLTHGGSNTMNHCVVWIAPRREFAVMIATNQGGQSAFLACDEAASNLIRKYLASEGAHR